MIEQWQVDQYHQQGFLVVEHVLTSEEIAALQHDFDQWVEESRSQSAPGAILRMAVRVSTLRAITLPTILLCVA